MRPQRDADISLETFNILGREQYYLNKFKPSYNICEEAGLYLVTAVKKKTSRTHKLGYQLYLVFEITQGSRGELLLRTIASYFGCGDFYYSQLDKATGKYIVSGFDQIYNTIISFFFFFISIRLWR